MTLTEFLLARIADTIATAREIQAMAITRGIQPDDPREPALRLALIALADCEAKRRIVGRESLAFGNVGQVDVKHSRTLRDIAAVYADHPDYREEWRP